MIGALQPGGPQAVRPHQERNLVMTKSKNTTRQLTDDALFAFWQGIAERFPEATTGELSPWPTMKLQIAAETAVEEWIDNNVPAK
jgi:hypothetical protein